MDSQTIPEMSLVSSDCETEKYYASKITFRSTDFVEFPLSSPFLLAATLEYPIECPANDTNTEEDNADRGRSISNNGTQDNQRNEPRPNRHAARKAQDRIKQTLKDI